MKEGPLVQMARPAEPAMGPSIGNQMDALRKNVHESVLLELKEEEEKSAKWPGPLKGLLNRN